MSKMSLKTSVTILEHYRETLINRIPKDKLIESIEVILEEIKNTMILIKNASVIIQKTIIVVFLLFARIVTPMYHE